MGHLGVGLGITRSPTCKKMGAIQDRLNEWAACNWDPSSHSGGRMTDNASIAVWLTVARRPLPPSGGVTSLLIPEIGCIAASSNCRKDTISVLSFHLPSVAARHHDIFAGRTRTEERHHSGFNRPLAVFQLSLGEEGEEGPDCCYRPFTPFSQRNGRSRNRIVFLIAVDHVTCSRVRRRALY